MDAEQRQTEKIRIEYYKMKLKRLNRKLVAMIEQIEQAQALFEQIKKPIALLLNRKGGAYRSGA